MTKAEVFGLKENPFEPTGAAVGKYPFVPPENFPILEQKIEEAGIEKKFYALLVNSPHGAGKSTTMEYLRNKASNGGYLSFLAPVILTKLTNLSIQNFVEDILVEASKYRRVRPLKKSEFGLTASTLSKALVDALSPIASRSKLMLWIVDEFDILADRSKEQQQEFLQFLRDVIDAFAYRDIPIAFIMSHTKYSSREFERYLSKRHEPFRSRLVASVPLAYSYDEVKQIVLLRLKKARIVPREENDLFPFSEQAIKSLYDLILSVRGTDNLDNFRVFERVCHFALIEGAKRDLKEIDSELIQELFKEYGLKEIQVHETPRFSIETAQEINKIKSKSLLERNEAILQGIITGISKSVLLGRDTSLNKIQTSYVGPAGTGNIVLSSLSLSISYQNRTINVLWIIATNKLEIIRENDLEQILQVLGPKLKEPNSYHHLNLLSYISSVDLRRIPDNSFDRLFWFSDGLAEDLIGLGIDSENKEFIRSFNEEIAPLLLQLITRETNDITSALKNSTYEIIKTVHVVNNLEHSSTQEAIRLTNKRLFMRKTMISKRFIREAIESGFLIEEASQIKPVIPNAHSHLLNLLENGPKKYPDLIEIFGEAGSAIIESALEFGLIKTEANNIIQFRLEDYETELGDLLKSLRDSIKKKGIKESEPGNWITWLLDSYKIAKENNRIYSAHVILSTIKQLGGSIKEEIEKYSIKTELDEKEEITIPPQPKGKIFPEEQTSESVEKQESVSETPNIQEALLHIIKSSGPLTLQEIDSQMKQRGYEEDVKRTVLRLILQGKLKVIFAG